MLPAPILIRLITRLSPLLLLAIFACRYSPTDTTNDPRTSTLRGWVRLEGKEDSVHRDHSGAKIELLGTKLSTMSAFDGAYELASIPEGIYTAIYSAPGYDTLIEQQIPILPPNGAYVDGKTLRVSPDVDIVLDTIEQPDQFYLQMRTRVTCRYPKGPSEVFFRLFVGRTRAVTCNWADYDAALVSRFNQQQSGGFNGTFSFGKYELRFPYLPFGKRSFKSGDSAYIVAYTGGSQAIVDPVGGYVRWVGLEHRSNAVGFVMP